MNINTRQAKRKFLGLAGDSAELKEHVEDVFEELERLHHENRRLSHQVFRFKNIVKSQLESTLRTMEVLDE